MVAAKSAGIKLKKYIKIFKMQFKLINKFACTKSFKVIVKDTMKYK